MSFKLFHEPIIPTCPAGFTTEELRRYLGVGRNNITPIVRRFGIQKLHGIYPERVVWRQLFGLGAEDAVAQEALREPLVDINWVSRATGVPQSTIRGHIRSERWNYDYGIQLGDKTTIPSPRLRRWIPALIRNQVCGSPLPVFVRIPARPSFPNNSNAHSSSSVEAQEFRPEYPCNQPSKDVFAALFASPEPASR